MVLCVCIHTYMYIKNVYMRVCVCADVYIYMIIYIYVYIYIHTCICICVNDSLFISYIYVCIYRYVLFLFSYHIWGCRKYIIHSTRTIKGHKAPNSLEAGWRNGDKGKNPTVPTPFGHSSYEAWQPLNEDLV